MNCAARSNAFDDLLPDIASLIEVERPLLLRLLRQIALANVDAIGGDARLDAVQFQSLESHGGGACSKQRAPQLLYVLGREPNLMILPLAANQRAFDSLPGHRLNL